jgi:RNase H-fold protein (predicted Holliday junction resolvase)
MNKKELILGLDVSTKTIGVSLSELGGELLELTHISPKAKPLPSSKTEELMKKADIFSIFIDKYVGMNIKYIVIEEPLLRSNNVNTVGTLLRFNGMVTKICYDKLGIVPEYISTYEARKNAFPELMQPNAKGVKVLFGSYPKDIDKKVVIWEKVAAREPNIEWQKDKNGNLKKEMFDASDAYCVSLAFMKKNKFITETV